jgi:hypothetical protein
MKPCLLVIDNANELEDLRTHYKDLRRCPNFHALLTSRLPSFEQAKMLMIDGLPEDKALELFEKYYPKLQAAEIPLVKSIRTAVGGNTLTLIEKLDTRKPCCLLKADIG